MWMRLVKYLLCGPEMDKGAEDAVDVAPLGAAGIELTVAVGAGPAFAKAVVAFLVHQSFLVDGGEVSPACPYILSSFEHDGFDTQFDEAEGSEEPGRAGPDDDHFFGRPAYVLPLQRNELYGL